jgi:hypothetical protein
MTTSLPVPVPVPVLGARPTRAGRACRNPVPVGAGPGGAGPGPHAEASAVRPAKAVTAAEDATRSPDAPPHRAHTAAGPGATERTSSPSPGGPATGAAPEIRRLRYEPDPGAEEPPARAARPLPPPEPTEPPDDGTARRHAHRVLHLALEVLAGRRPAGHLSGHFEPAALRYLRAVGRRPGSGPARLTSLRVCTPHPGAAEVAAVCCLDGRVRALAARFERAEGPGGWRCTVLRLA